MLNRAGIDISNAKRRVRIPLAFRINLRIRPIRVKRKILSSVGEKKRWKTSSSPIPLKWKRKQNVVKPYQGSCLFMYVLLYSVLRVLKETLIISHLFQQNIININHLQKSLGKESQIVISLNIKEVSRLCTVWKLHSPRFLSFGGWNYALLKYLKTSCRSIQLLGWKLWGSSPSCCLIAASSTGLSHLLNVKVPLMLNIWMRPERRMKKIKENFQYLSSSCLILRFYSQKNNTLVM